jgi:hypothetical protein
MSQDEEEITGGEPEKGTGTTVERLRDKDPAGKQRKPLGPMMR